ncbi:hypothetical protein KIH32_19440 [Pseudomonas fluorescens]|uniref:hypothetical protein n=1 Tax=Pseudomonas fluorescens TaxID=294 RepID=UPI001BDB248B|nr:hypothetical protein [Pseudomonas fluorescens]MBT0626093.1 hypothetical protein [Pseudomonas fluorescens]
MKITLGKGTDGDSRSLTRWGRPLQVGLVALFIFFALVVFFYLSKFNNGLSPKSDIWGNFGSFIGGVLGPAISLVTLLALLRTIDLQLDQGAHFQAEGVSARLAEYKNSQLQLLDQQILMFERMIDRYDIEGERIFNLPKLQGATRADDLKQVDKNIDEAEEQVGKLIKLSVRVSLSDFSSVEELRSLIREELNAINPYLYDLK